MSQRTTVLRLSPLYLLALAVPVSVGAGGIATGLVTVAALVLAVRERGAVAWPPRSVTVTLTLLILTYLVATTAAAPQPRHWYKFCEELWIKLLLVAVPVLVGRHRRHIPRILVCCLGMGVVAAVYGVWQHFSGWDPVRGCSLPTHWGHISPGAFFSHHLSWGGQLLIFVLLTVSGLLTTTTRRMRGALAGVLVLLLVALAWSYARGALFGVLPGIAVAVLLARGRARLVGTGLLVLPPLVALALPSVGLHFVRLLDLDHQLTRLNLWHSSLIGLAARPLTGWGPGNFDAMMRLHEVYGFYDVRAHAHNDLLMHAVNAGLPGLTAALALLVAIAVALVRGLRSRQPDRWVLTGALAVHAGITAAGMFQVYQTDDEVETLLYLVLGLALAAAGDCQGGGPVRHWFGSRPAVPDGSAPATHRKDER